MPKQKTKKAVAKRMKLSAGGKVLRRRMGHGHLLSAKSAKRRRGLRRDTTLAGQFARNYRAMLGG